MNQKEDESLEDLVERFMYNVKREKLHHLGSDTLKTLLLRTIRDENNAYFDNKSRGKARVGKSTSKSVSQAKPGNLFDDFKTEILSNLTKQVEILRMQDEGKENVDICVAESHDVKHCPSLPRFKEVYQEDNG